MINRTYDLQCLFSPLMYTDHSAALCAIFLRYKSNTTEAMNFLRFHNDDENYGTRLRDLPQGHQLRAFAAFCHAPPVEWSLHVHPYEL